MLEKWILSNVLGTAILLVVVLTLRLFGSRYVRTTTKNWSPQQRLRILGYIKTASVILFVFGVVYIWGEQIQGFAVSVFAIAFAIVFSVKENLMNLNGAFLRLQGHAYEIGDRITIKGIRGDVIDVSMLSTTVMEIGTEGLAHQLTGRKIVFPNSLLLSEIVTNESFLGTYQLIDLKFPLDLDEDWQSAKEILMGIAKEESAPYLDHARNRIRMMEKTKSIELPSVEPKVFIELPESKKVTLCLRMPSPAHLKDRMSQAILSKYLEKMYKTTP